LEIQNVDGQKHTWRCTLVVCIADLGTSSRKIIYCIPWPAKWMGTRSIALINFYIIWDFHMVLAQKQYND
jgi:hypothetical protein